MRHRDVPSFATGLESSIVNPIKQANTHQQGVQECLQTYQVEYGHPPGILNDFGFWCGQHGLHKAVVRLYTADSWVYKDVNQALRASDESKIKKLAPYIAALIKALRSLESDFSALGIQAPTTLYRRMELKKHESSTYQVGKSFVWNGFTSTSCFEPPTHFGSTLFEIEMMGEGTLDSALYVEPFSSNPGEWEVLIPVGTYFVVDSVAPTIKLKVLHCVF
eukprot:TRINITY_DN67256_c1_g13_i1.p1 TRINITY_DN67256_c1_g13~~TRINITY_DN67256_c1_g13_i1.p1  ORF type:complete len:220 (-),score=29.89 TRINITY_DN67256_c1_g13_i1:107-766(-)